MSENAPILDHISALVAEEKELRARLSRGEISPDAEQVRLRHLETELDQYWDLLRQRDARTEFGEKPDEAVPRPIGTVEDCSQ